MTREEDYYDFESRYEIDRTDFVCPADLPDETAERAQDTALAVHRLLGLHGFARVDLMLDSGGGLHVLEANPSPGLTGTTLVPQAGEAAGIGFDELVGRILALARPGAGLAEAPQTPGH